MKAGKREKKKQINKATRKKERARKRKVNKYLSEELQIF